MFIEVIARDVAIVSMLVWEQDLLCENDHVISPTSRVDNDDDDADVSSCKNHLLRFLAGSISFIYAMRYMWAFYWFRYEYFFYARMPSPYFHPSSCGILLFCYFAESLLTSKVAKVSDMFAALSRRLILLGDCQQFVISYVYPLLLNLKFLNKLLVITKAPFQTLR